MSESSSNLALVDLQNWLKRVPELDFGWVVTDHESSTEVSFPCLEDWAEIDEQDVVFLDPYGQEMSRRKV